MQVPRRNMTPTLDGERLIFINDTHTPVLTHGAGNREEMMLVIVQTPAKTAIGVVSEGLELS
jgi:uncharacterized lipoprotein YbaY